MKTCIICRKDKIETDFNDEHVIPDSVGGYYHIYSVCCTCNSTLGSKVDNKLTNHQFIKFQRHSLKIAGKSGFVPNPFDGVHELRDDKDQKLRLNFDSDGKFDIHLLPNVPKTFTDSFRITIDKKDADKTDEIIDKFLRRKGIPKEKVIIEKKEDSTEKPWVHTTLTIDIRDFKMAILKIAYEFAVDSIPKYFPDSQAIVISEVLRDADYENLFKKIKFLGSGMDKQIMQPFTHLIDLENNNHYLILVEVQDVGLVCLVNLFNTLNLGVVLSEKNNFIEEIIVGKNDITEKTFQKLTLDQIVEQTYSPVELRFQYFFSDMNDLREFTLNDSDPRFEFYKQNDKMPLYTSDNNIVYEDINEKLHQEHLQKIPLGDTVNEIITQIDLDEILFIKLLPINKLFQITSVRIQQFRVRKI